MNYKLTIEKYEDNPKYDPEAVKAYKSPFGYRDFSPEVMEPRRLAQILQVEITDEEYKAIKKAVINIV